MIKRMEWDFLYGLTILVTIQIDGKRHRIGSNHIPKFQRNLSDSLSRSGVNTFGLHTFRHTDRQGLVPVPQ